MTGQSKLLPGLGPVRKLSGEPSICLLCRGSKLLCGKPACPALMRANSIARLNLTRSSLEVEGSSPPSVFVGRMGYPRVSIGPMVPPLSGDTSHMNDPSLWYRMQISEFVQMITSLFRGTFPATVNKPEEGGRLLQELQELALSSRSPDTDVIFSRPLSAGISLSSDVQPFGPSAPLSKMQVSGTRSNLKLERAFYDEDLKAADAMWNIYRSGEPVQSIQRVLSLAMLGVANNRRLVPTRWSITAVDDTLGKRLRDRVIRYEQLGEFRLHYSRSMGNLYAVLLVPGFWSYELMEIFHSGSVWNPSGGEVAIAGDCEGTKERSSYASIGGCYYSARLAVLEHLDAIRKCATVIVIREALPSYLLPVGVWTVREGIRDAMRSKPQTFSDMKSSLSALSELTKASMAIIIEESSLLRRMIYQSRLTRFLMGDSS